jgi:hypothetical protein
MAIDQFQKNFQGPVAAQSKHYPGIFLKELRKNTNTLGHDSVHLGLDANHARPKYKPRAFKIFFKFA